MEYLERIKQVYLDWKESRFLKAHGCKNRKQYERKYDPDYNPRATGVKDYFHGYLYIYRFDDHNHSVYHCDLAYNGTYVIHTWCEKNLQNKFRMDCLRVVLDSYTLEWKMDELGGSDFIFIAFKDEQDMMWFKLRWS